VWRSSVSPESISVSPESIKAVMEELAKKRDR